MGSTLLLSLLAITAGFGVLRLLGLRRGAVAVGLIAPTGLAWIAVVATWSALLGAPAVVAGMLLLGSSVVGLGFVVADRTHLLQAVRKVALEQPWTLATFGAALLIPYVVLLVAYWSVQVPLSPHDGAFHTEIIHMLRRGVPWANWYPPGLHATFAAVLALVPWVDTARGSFELALSLTLLAPLAVLGLGQATWRNLRVATLGMLLVSLTDLFPYFPQLWSGWPLAMAMLLLVGLWAVATEYVARPTRRRALLAALLLGAIILVHGTEVYTAALLLLVLGVGAWKRLVWNRLLPDLLLAGVLALALAAPYLPSLLRWAGAGGAAGVGVQEADVLQTVAATAGVNRLFTVFAIDALGIDLPLRVVLIAAGAVWVVRRGTGRSVLMTGVGFAGLAITFTFLLWIPLVTAVFAAVFPWGMHYRLFMVVAIVGALLAGVGWEALAQVLAGRARVLERRIQPGTPLHRRLWRLAGLMPLTWLVVATWAMTQFQAFQVPNVIGFVEDDAGAMAWLRQTAQPGELLANDRYADAGIWAPYKAGVGIVLPRLAPAEPARALLLANVAGLDQVAAARQAACDLNVRYVYRGAAVPMGWEERAFPPLAVLRAAPFLEEAFASGEAVVFRLRLDCLG